MFFSLFSFVEEVLLRDVDNSFVIFVFFGDPLKKNHSHLFQLRCGEGRTLLGDSLSSLLSCDTDGIVARSSHTFHSAQIVRLDPASMSV